MGSALKVIVFDYDGDKNQSFKKDFNSIYMNSETKTVKTKFEDNE
jgi:hypothetical protein